MENQEFTPSFFRFEDLRVYQKALDYYTWTHNKTEFFPNSESNPLVKNFTIDALEIASKISEGSSRNKIQFIDSLREAKTAIRRCVVNSSVSIKLGYINEEEEDESRRQLMELTKMLGALIGSLQKDNRSNNQPKQQITEYQSNNY